MTAATTRSATGRAILRWALVVLTGTYPFAMAYDTFAGVQPLDPSATLRALAACVTFTILAYWLARFVIADPDARAAYVGGTGIAIALYGTIARAAGASGLPVSASNRWFAIGYAATVVVGAAAMVKPWRIVRRDLVPITLVAAALVCVNVGRAVSHQWRVHRGGWHEASDRIVVVPPQSLPSTATSRPDIYYIVLDALGRPDILRNNYKLDVTDFVDFLRDRGFYLPRHVHSNYGRTLLSFSSFLNLGYLDAMATAMGPDDPSWTPLGGLIRRNVLMQLAKNAGYRITVINSDYGPVKRFPQADVCVCEQYGLAMFEQAILDDTPFGTLPVSRWTYGAHRQKILDEFARLEREPNDTAPRFVFAHILAAHPPFVLTADGGFRQSDVPFAFLDGADFPGTPAEYVQGYHDQVQFVLTQLRTIVDHILSQPGPRPVIIIHGDHGPASLLLERVPSNLSIHERMSPFAAYEFPNGPEGLYNSMTLVNGARALANAYLGTALPKLPDVAQFSGGDNPFDFTPVPLGSDPSERGGAAQ